jgi:hypothetical protein
VSAWEDARVSELRRSRAAFEAREDFTELVAEAGRRGFRRVTLIEQLNPGSVDAYAWRGGVWVRAS